MTFWDRSKYRYSWPVMELAYYCSADVRVMVVGEVSVDTGREGTDERVMGGEEVVVGTEGSAGTGVGVGSGRGRIELVGGGVCPAAIRVGVGDVMG